MKNVFLSFFIMCASSQAESLVVDILSIPSEKGRLAWALFSHKDGFPSKHEMALKKNYLSISSLDKVELIISDLEPGTYALAVFQDMNENEKLDKNFFGVPVESIGFSNNPKLFMGPPRFQQAQFAFPETKKLEIKMLR